MRPLTAWNTPRSPLNFALLHLSQFASADTPSSSRVFLPSHLNCPKSSRLLLRIADKVRGKAK
jgi:hypothetical protein